VIDLGSYQFGVPVRITARVGFGRGEIVDIERESELGGPIHTKGTLILRGLLLDRFGDQAPLRLACTLCMEQSYIDVDGDSASLAEACALLSVLADAPIRQDYAVTGSIDQRGQVQAVGGVNEKIEGFFRVTREKRGKAAVGVILPSSNRDELMLDEEVVAAAAEGRFPVFGVDTLEDALFLLTGRQWDKGDDALEPAIINKLHHLASLYAAPRPQRVAAVATSKRVEPSVIPAAAADGEGPRDPGRGHGKSRPGRRSL